MADTDKNISLKRVINEKGEFVRKASTFRNWVTADGSSGYQAEADRYHLYVSLACPWAHRVLTVRKLKGLEHVLPITVVDWLMGPKGWEFTDKKPECSLDPVNNASCLRDIYLLAEPEYQGRYTVPVLWDKQKKTIVNNESSELIRMLNTEFNQFCKTEEQRNLDLYPSRLHAEIDKFNDFIYPNINNGVYRAGFASSQEAYTTAVHEVFDALTKIEEVLSSNRYLCGEDFTEADVRLFTTLIRFDPVYHGHFKCNKKRIIDYPNLWGFIRELYQLPLIRDTVNMQHITSHYYQSHLSVNPTGIVPIGPDLNYEEPHGRDKLKASYDLTKLVQ